jgi:hypothetical protein
VIRAGLAASCMLRCIGTHLNWWDPYAPRSSASWPVRQGTRLPDWSGPSAATGAPSGTPPPPAAAAAQLPSPRLHPPRLCSQPRHSPGGTVRMHARQRHRDQSCGNSRTGNAVQMLYLVVRLQACGDALGCAYGLPLKASVFLTRRKLHLIATSAAVYLRYDHMVPPGSI